MDGEDTAGAVLTHELAQIGQHSHFSGSELRPTPAASMLGLTNAFWLAPSSITLTPSTVTFLLPLGAPLIEMSRIDVHVVKSRLLFESRMPGMVDAKPNTSRPLS